MTTTELPFTIEQRKFVMLSNLAIQTATAKRDGIISEQELHKATKLARLYGASYTEISNARGNDISRQALHQRYRSTTWAEPKLPT